MSTYDYEPDPKYYGPEPRHISHGFRKVGREGMTYQLPEPHFIWQNPDKGYYTAAQMQAAWQAGRDTVMYSMRAGEWPEAKAQLLYLLDKKPRA